MLDSPTSVLNKTLTNEVLGRAPETVQFDWMRCKRIFRAFCYIGKTFVLWEMRDKYPTEVGHLKILDLNFSQEGYTVTVRQVYKGVATTQQVTHEISTLVPGKLLVCIPPVLVLIKRPDKMYPQFQLLFKVEDGFNGQLCISDNGKFEDALMEAGL